MTLEELRGRLDDGRLALLDVRSPQEFAGASGYGCDPRQGHIPGARHVDVALLYSAHGVPRPAAEVRELVGLPEGSELVAYCHSGSRSAFAAQVLRDAGYAARNYEGSWHEWSRNPDLPAE